MGFSKLRCRFQILNDRALKAGLHQTFYVQMYFSFLKVTGPNSVCLETYKRIKWEFSCCYEETDTSFFSKKLQQIMVRLPNTVDFHSKSLIPVDKTTFQRHREIVAIPNTVSFFIKIPKCCSKKSQIPNTEKPYDPHRVQCRKFLLSVGLQ